METDYYFRMGATHSICQDYAAAGLSEGRPFALLSDGCSGSPIKGDPGSPHTDFGSRMLIRASLRQLPQMCDGGNFPMDKIAIEAEGMIRQIGLRRSSLDATLLAAVPFGGSIRTYQIGDGVIVGIQRDGIIKAYTTHFGANMPYYLSYSLDLAREFNFRDAAKTVTRAIHTFNPGSGWDKPTTWETGLDEYRMCQTRMFDTRDTQAVLLMSDGAESFMKKGTTEAVPLEAVLDQICAIKNYQGEFLTRRLNAFLTRFCVQEGWVHNDDFSCAGIYTEPPAEAT